MADKVPAGRRIRLPSQSPEPERRSFIDQYRVSTNGCWASHAPGISIEKVVEKLEMQTAKKDPDPVEYRFVDTNITRSPVMDPSYDDDNSSDDDNRPEKDIRPDEYNCPDLAVNVSVSENESAITDSNESEKRDVAAGGDRRDVMPKPKNYSASNGFQYGYNGYTPEFNQNHHYQSYSQSAVLKGKGRGIPLRSEAASSGSNSSIGIAGTGKGRGQLPIGFGAIPPPVVGTPLPSIAPLLAKARGRSLSDNFSPLASPPGRRVDDNGTPIADATAEPNATAAENGISTTPAEQTDLKDEYDCGCDQRLVGDQQAAGDQQTIGDKPAAGDQSTAVDGQPITRRKTANEFYKEKQEKAYQYYYNSLTRNYRSRYIDTHCHIDLMFRREEKLNPNFNWNFFDYKNHYRPTWAKNYEACIANFCFPHIFMSKQGKDLWNHLLQVHKVFLVPGCHPKQANMYTSEVEAIIEEMASVRKVVAIGEMGLDYSEGKSNADLQKDVFKKQIRLAIRLNKPILIHCRDAEEDCFEVMKEIIPRDYPIHRHCFLESFEQGKRLIDHFSNLYIGLTPCVCDPRPYQMRLLKEFPLERILIETDSPFFLPKYCHRAEYGKLEYCHPGMAYVVGLRLAFERHMDNSEVYRIIRENTRKLYNI